MNAVPVPTELAVVRGQTIARLIGRWTDDPYATLLVVLEEAFDAGMAAGRGTVPEKVEP